MSWLSKRTRNICKKIMFTPDEWREVEFLWTQFREFDDGNRYASFGDWARQLLMWGQVEKIEVPFEPARLRREIRSIGVNVNQIAHTANIARSVSAEQVQAILRGQEELWDIFTRMEEEYARKTSGLSGRRRNS